MSLLGFVSLILATLGEVSGLLLSIAPNHVALLVFEMALDSTFGAWRCTPEETSSMNGETPEIGGQMPESNRLSFLGVAPDVIDCQFLHQKYWGRIRQSLSSI